MRASAVFALLLAMLSGAVAQEVAVPPLDPVESIPSAEAIDNLLHDEPISLSTWPTWRQRYLDWYYDTKNETEAMSAALRAFIADQAEANGGQLPAALQRDEVAWLLLAYVQEARGDENALSSAQASLRKALELNPTSAKAHSRLAYSLLAEAHALGSPPDAATLAAAEAEVAEAERLDSRTGDGLLQALIANARDEVALSCLKMEQHLQERPGDQRAAAFYVGGMLNSDANDPARLENALKIARHFPDDAKLQAYQIVALLRLDRVPEAKEFWEKAKQGGLSLADVLSPESAQRIEERLSVSSPAFERGLQALDQQDYPTAEAEFRRAMAEAPGVVDYARLTAEAIVQRRDVERPAALVGPLVEQFPNDGALHTYYAVAWAREGKWRDAAHEVEAARKLGFDPAEIVDQPFFDEIEANSRPGVLPWIVGGVVAFLGVYAVIIAAMACTGLLLALRTKGQALAIPEVVNGEVMMTGGERWLARAYRGALLASLFCFYVAIPFVVVGLLMVTGGLLYGVFMLRRIPIKLVLFILLVGLGMAWAVIKSVFARSGGDDLGLPVSESQHPRLWDSLRDVAAKVGTEPIHEVRLVPGADFAVHQQGRGPFGIFGQKRRHLILGLAALPGLSVRELKAILAHEYAHFSHQDTFYSRLIYQVTMSIEQTLSDMGASLGTWNYINPFYWFFYLYYRAYMMLAAGFSRSREYLADRMAVSLYGRSAFFSALHKAATEGRLFETTAHANIRQHLAEGQAFDNVYDAFRRFRDEELASEEREKLDRAIVDGSASLFASHPTIRQRLQAASGYPEGHPGEEQSADTLLDEPLALEVQMTKLLTDAPHLHMQMLAQAQAAQQA